MLAKCIFGHKNTLCQPVSRTFLFLECRGGWASFQCKILATACLCAVPFHGKPHYGAVHSVSMLWQTIWCDWLVRPVQTHNEVPPQNCFYPFILLSFYPSHISSFFLGGCPAVFGTFWSHNMAKSGQNGPIWGRNYPRPNGETA